MMEMNYGLILRSKLRIVVFVAVIASISTCSISRNSSGESFECYDTGLTVDDAKIFAPKHCKPIQCEVTSSRGTDTDGFNCTIGNDRRNLPDACHHVQNALLSAHGKGAGHRQMEKACQARLAGISLYLFSCKELPNKELSLAFSFDLPTCGKTFSGPDDAVMVGFNAKNESIHNYYAVHPVCRVFFFGANNLGRFHPDESIQVSYDCLGIGLRDKYPEVYYYLSFTSVPSADIINYTIVFLDVEEGSMRLIAAAWLSTQRIHLVFLPIEGVTLYHVQAEGEQFSYSHKVWSCSVEITGIPPEASTVTVNVTPDQWEVGRCSRQWPCSSITVTLHDRHQLNLPTEVDPTPLPGNHHKKEVWLPAVVVMVLVACLLAVLVAVGLSIIFIRRRSSGAHRGKLLKVFGANGFSKHVYRVLKRLPKVGNSRPDEFPNPDQLSLDDLKGGDKIRLGVDSGMLNSCDAESDFLESLDKTIVNMPQDRKTLTRDTKTLLSSRCDKSSGHKTRREDVRRKGFDQVTYIPDTSSVTSESSSASGGSDSTQDGRQHVVQAEIHGTVDGQNKDRTSHETEQSSAGAVCLEQNDQNIADPDPQGAAQDCRYEDPAQPCTEETCRLLPQDGGEPAAADLDQSMLLEEREVEGVCSWLSDVSQGEGLSSQFHAFEMLDLEDAVEDNSPPIVQRHTEVKKPEGPTCHDRHQCFSLQRCGRAEWLHCMNWSADDTAPASSELSSLPSDILEAPLLSDPAALSLSEGCEAALPNASVSQYQCQAGKVIQAGEYTEQTFKKMPAPLTAEQSVRNSLAQNNNGHQTRQALSPQAQTDHNDEPSLNRGQAEFQESSWQEPSKLVPSWDPSKYQYSSFSQGQAESDQLLSNARERSHSIGRNARHLPDPGNTMPGQADGGAASAQPQACKGPPEAWSERLQSEHTRTHLIRRITNTRNYDPSLYPLSFPSFYPSFIPEDSHNAALLEWLLENTGPWQQVPGNEAGRCQGTRMVPQPRAVEGADNWRCDQLVDPTNGRIPCQCDIRTWESQGNEHFSLHHEVRYDQSYMHSQYQQGFTYDPCNAQDYNAVFIHPAGYSQEPQDASLQDFQTRRSGGRGEDHGQQADRWGIQRGLEPEENSESSTESNTHDWRHDQRSHDS